MWHDTSQYWHVVNTTLSKHSLQLTIAVVKSRVLILVGTRRCYTKMPADYRLTMISSMASYVSYGCFTDSRLIIFTVDCCLAHAALVGELDAGRHKLALGRQQQRHHQR